MASGACTVHTQTQTHSPCAIYSEQGSHSLLIWKFLSLCKIRHSTLSCCCYSYIITARRFTFARNLISNQIKSVGLHQQREVFWKTENTFYLVLIWLGLRFYYSIPLSWTWTHLDRTFCTWNWADFTRLNRNDQIYVLDKSFQESSKTTTLSNYNERTLRILDECNYGFIKICHLIGQHNRDATACLQVIN